MSSAKRISISMDVEGLLLIHHNNTIFRLRFDTQALERIINTNHSTLANPLTAYGIVGKIDIGSGYLIVITEREVAATIHDKVIYRITDTLAIPLDYKNASNAFQESARRRKDNSATTSGNGSTNSGSSSSDEHTDLEPDEIENEDDENIESMYNNPSTDARVVEDVLLRKPPSTIALRNWFPSTAATPSATPSGNCNTKKRQRMPDAGLELVPKLLKSIKVLFNSKSFYFSLDIDLTNSPLTTAKRPRQVFVFNRHMSLLFAHSPLYLPIIQGFVRSVDIPLEGQMELDENTANNKLMIISRRSTKRPGVRYLRRGIDDQGYCANWVETEQLLLTESNMCSYIQVRGSMPVYFSQSPYKLQPRPKLIRRKPDSVKAFTKHCTSLNRNYGQVLGISLVEMPPSKEGAVGAMYSEIAHENNFNLEWFDFHQVCKGMKFSRVTELFNTQVGEKLQEFGWTDLQAGRVQRGVFRINCIDCLDRTNVVETACAKTILQQQLEQQLDSDGSASISSQIREDFELKFNGLWADNGDAISRQYSSTNALKGDFTRTQKRNYRGVLTDAFLSLSRYFYGMVTDFFLQAVLDYLLGNVSEQVFDEFEQHLQSRDPSVNFDSIRNSAVEIASSIVVASDDEHIYGGWWLLTPSKQGKIRRVDLVDCILLVTDQAVYVCEYDLKSDKVLDFTRISSSSIHTIQTGAYFGEVLSAASKDASRNVGFVLKFNDGDTLNSSSPSRLDASKSHESFLAFKVPMVQVDNEYNEIVNAITVNCRGVTLEEAAIVTLEQAKSDTGTWSMLEYQVKKALWA